RAGVGRGVDDDVVGPQANLPEARGARPRPDDHLAAVGAVEPQARVVAARARRVRPQVVMRVGGVVGGDVHHAVARRARRVAGEGRLLAPQLPQRDKVPGGDGVAVDTDAASVDGYLARRCVRIGPNYELHRAGHVADGAG